MSEADASAEPEASNATPALGGEPTAEVAGAHVPTPAEDGAAEVAATGDPRVDDAVSRLTEVDVLPLAEQVEVYTDIHRRLAAVLADPDSRG